MVRCLVNDTPRSADSSLKTWAELLTALDSEAEAGGLTVTAVRFDGVDQPTFRGSGIGQVPLSVVELIEVECVDRRRLLRSVLGAAQLSLPALASSACRLAEVYRKPDVQEGRQQLAILVATIRTLTDLTLASSAAVGTGLADVQCQGESGADVLGAVAVALDTLSHNHDASEWNAVADALERDLAPALLHWGTVFDAMQDGWAA